MRQALRVQGDSIESDKGSVHPYSYLSEQEMRCHELGEAVGRAGLQVVAEPTCQKIKLMKSLNYGLLRNYPAMWLTCCKALHD